MKNLVQSIKKIIFSQKCPICKKISNNKYYICDTCYSYLRKIRKLRNIGNYYYLYYYDKELKRVIAEYKLANRKNLVYELATLIREPLKYLIKEMKIDVVIPVPISKKRMAERGFNQVEELLKVCDVKYHQIAREKNTKHMFEILDKKRRQENIRGAFSRGGLDFDNKNILIVDDIVTTGSTVKEIIKELKRNNFPKEIYIFSITISRMFKI